jgi:hypothetical protein
VKHDLWTRLEDWALVTVPTELLSVFPGWRIWADGIACILQNNLIRNNSHSLNRDLDFICIKLFWILTLRQWHPHPATGQVFDS